MRSPAATGLLLTAAYPSLRKLKRKTNANGWNGRCSAAPRGNLHPGRDRLRRHLQPIRGAHPSARLADMNHQISSHPIVGGNPAKSSSHLVIAQSQTLPWRRIKRRVGISLDATMRFWRQRILNRPRPIDRWIADLGDQTLRLEYPLSSSSVVVDVGGFQGNWSQCIFERYGCSIHIFEPVSAYVQEITRRFEGYTKISVYPFGLAGAAEQAQIALLGDASSVLIGGQGQCETIELRDVAEVLAPLLSHGIDLIKINIEGGEYDLLARMIESEVVRHCRNIQVQFHSRIPGAVERRKAIQDALSSSHRLTYEYPFVWENWCLKG